MQDPSFICTQGCGSRSTAVAIPEAERAAHDAFHAEHGPWDRLVVPPAPAGCARCKGTFTVPAPTAVSPESVDRCPCLPPTG